MLSRDTCVVLKIRSNRFCTDICSVKLKMEKGDGMSFAEFCYPLLQAWDWWHQYSHEDVQIQIGGSDQFGNIVTGIDAIRHMRKFSEKHRTMSSNVHESAMHEPLGLTVPLLTTTSGEKFGKSAGNAIWLDKSMTPVFDLYGFFVSTPDADVERLLRVLTLLDLEHIKSVMQEQSRHPSKRVAQHLLARHFVEMVHGEEEAEKAEAQHRASFGRVDDTPENTFVEMVRKDVEVRLARSQVIGQNLARVLQLAGFVSSRSKAQNLIELDAIRVYRKASAPESKSSAFSFVKLAEMLPRLTDRKVKDKIVFVENDWVLEDKFLVIRIGRKAKILTIELTDNPTEAVDTEAANTTSTA